NMARGVQGARTECRVFSGSQFVDTPVVGHVGNTRTLWDSAGQGLNERVELIPVRIRYRLARPVFRSPRAAQDTLLYTAAPDRAWEEIRTAPIREPGRWKASRVRRATGCRRRRAGRAERDLAPRGRWDTPEPEPGSPRGLPPSVA